MRALVIGAVLLAFAGSCSSEEKPPATRACAPLDRIDDARSAAGVTTMLVDVSASVRGASQAPDYRAALKEHVVGAIGRGDVVNIGSFDGSAASVRWTAQDKFAALTAGRSVNQGIQTEQFVTCLGDAVDRAAATAPATDNTDVEGALQVAAGAGKAATRRTVVLATDGLSTTGCVNLADGPAGKLRWIDTIVARCPGQSDWPVALGGTDLVMLGIGHPADGVPPTGGVEFLRRLWESVCVVAKAASCEISSDPLAFSQGARAATKDPAVTFVADGGTAPPPAPLELVFPVDSLFATGSAVIDEKGAALIERRVKELPAAVQIEVVGHADARDTAAHNLTLSRDRADNVADVLHRAGFAMVSAGGVGERDAQCSQQKLPDGTWNEPCLSRDRKIVLKVKVD